MKYILLFLLVMCAAGPVRAEDVTLIDTPRVRMTMDRATGRWQIADRATGRVWASNPDQPRFGYAVIVIDGKQQQVDLVPASLIPGKGAESGVAFRPIKGKDTRIVVGVTPMPDGVAFAYSLYQAEDGPEVDSIRLLDDALAVTAQQQGAVAVPVRLGLLIPADSGKAFKHTFNTSGYEGCHMNMLGVMDNKGTVLLTWDDPYVSAEVRSITPAGAPQRLTVSMGMRKSAKSFQIHFPGAGDHVTIAKAYRQIVDQRDGFVTMERKIARDAERGKLLGASNVKLWSALSRTMNEESTKEERVRVNWTFDEAAQVAEHLKNDLKLDRVLFTVGGWIHRGYDNQHPDILPAAPECGGDAQLADMSARVMKLGYLLCLHDNYQDMYKDAPSWDESYLERRADGKVAAGGKWAGGRAYLTCAKQAVALAKRPQNLPAVRQLTKANSYFIDTTYAVDPQECYSKDHPLTRVDDIHWKCELSDYARSVFGVFGSECGREWAIPHSDFFEGLTGVSGKGFHNAALEETLGAKIVPLFELVYHDTMQMYGKYGYDHWKSAEYVLRHILIARPLNYHSIPSHLYWKTPAADPAPLAIEPSIDEFKVLDGRRISIRWAWNVAAKLVEDYNVMVHFTDASGKIVFQGDFAPKPATTQWTNGRLIQGPIVTTIPATAKGTYDIRVGLFHRERMDRVGLKGYGDKEKRIIVARLSVDGEKIALLPVTPAKEATGDTGIFVRAAGGWAEQFCATDRFLKNTHEILSPLNVMTSRLPMTSHRFLKPDGSVQATVFGDGAVRVTVNYGPDAYTIQSGRFGVVRFPQYGFLVESPTFIAFCADSFGGKAYESPALFTLASRDGRPIEESNTVRIFHAFGDPEVRLGAKAWTVKREQE